MHGILLISLVSFSLLSFAMEQVSSLVVRPVPSLKDLSLQAFLASDSFIIGKTSIPSDRMDDIIHFLKKQNTVLFFDIFKDIYAPVKRELPRAGGEFSLFQNRYAVFINERSKPVSTTIFDLVEPDKGPYYFDGLPYYSHDEKYILFVTKREGGATDVRILDVADMTQSAVEPVYSEGQVAVLYKPREGVRVFPCARHEELKGILRQQADNETYVFLINASYRFIGDRIRIGGFSHSYKHLCYDAFLDKAILGPVSYSKNQKRVLCIPKDQEICLFDLDTMQLTYPELGIDHYNDRSLRYVGLASDGTYAYLAWTFRILPRTGIRGRSDAVKLFEIGEASRWELVDMALNRRVALSRPFATSLAFEGTDEIFFTDAGAFVWFVMSKPCDLLYLYDVMDIAPNLTLWQIRVILHLSRVEDMKTYLADETNCNNVKRFFASIEQNDIQKALVNYFKLSTLLRSESAL